MLLHDETRCHDSGCPERHDCARYLECNTGTVHVASLNPYGKPPGPCPFRIDPDPSEAA